MTKLGDRAGEYDDLVTVGQFNSPLGLDSACVVPALMELQ